MLYRKGNQLLTRSKAIADIVGQLNSVVEPAYMDDDTLALYGFARVLPEEGESYLKSVTKECRKRALASVDWVSNAKHLTKETKAAVEAWRSVVRDCPDCTVLPPLPELITSKTKKSPPLNEVELERIRNYYTKDEGWLLFLQTWKDLGFPTSRNIVANLLIAYTKVRLDEIIGSI